MARTKPKRKRTKRPLPGSETTLMLDMKDTLFALRSVGAAARSEKGDVTVEYRSGGISVTSRNAVRSALVRLDGDKSSVPDGASGSFSVYRRPLEKMMSGDGTSQIKVAGDGKKISFVSKSSRSQLRGTIPCLPSPEDSGPEESKRRKSSRVDLNDEDAAALAACMSLMNLKQVGTVSKGEGMVLYIEVRNSRMRLSIWDRAHGAVATMPTSAGDTKTGMGVPKDMLDAAASLATSLGESFAVQIAGSSVSLVSDRFRLDTLFAAESGGSSISLKQMNQHMAKLRKAASGQEGTDQFRRLATTSESIRAALDDLSVVDAQEDKVLKARLSRGALVWSRKTAGGSAATRSKVELEGNWEDNDGFAVNVDAMADVAVAMPAGKVTLQMVDGFNLVLLRCASGDTQFSYPVALLGDQEAEAE